MIKVQIPLQVGQPDDGSRKTTISELATEPETPASFSRFMLPFSYRIEEMTHTGTTLPELFYRVNLLQSLSFTKRRKFLTRETGGMLYERAVWLDMCTEGWEKTTWGQGPVTVCLRNREMLIGMLPPRIVLFEAEHEFSTKENDKNQLCPVRILHG